MIWQIIKKIGLHFLRNRQQLFLLLALPIILILILSAALGSNFSSESSPIQLKIAFIEHGDEEEQIERFLQDVTNLLPPEIVQEMEASVKTMAPSNLLKSIFQQENVKEFLEVHHVSPAEREEIIGDESYTAIIELPENFSYDLLQAMVVGDEKVPTLRVTYNEEKELRASIIENFITQFQAEFTKATFLEKNQIDLSSILVTHTFGEVKVINEKNPISASAYYTIGMTVMNVLYLSGAIGYYAFHEKRIGTFNRILLANVSRWTYFTGILLSGTIFAFVQCLLIFGFSWIIFDIVWPDIFLFLSITLSFAISIGGLAVLLSSLNYRLNSETITNFFMNILATLFAVIGGSFYPIGDFSPLLQTIGNMTPNGAGLSAYLALLRGDSFAVVSEHVLYMTLFGLGAVVIAALCYPKKGVAI